MTTKELREQIVVLTIQLERMNLDDAAVIKNDSRLNKYMENAKDCLEAAVDWVDYIHPIEVK